MDLNYAKWDRVGEEVSARINGSGKIEVIV